MKSRQRRSDCPINFALEHFGDAWSLLIVRDLVFQGKTHYGDFLRSEENIATNILADRLQVLEQKGIITKKNQEYRLTKKGIDLVPALIELILWSAKYDPDTGAPKQVLKRARTDKMRFITELKQGLQSVLQ